jgi:hypothetical protein
MFTRYPPLLTHPNGHGATGGRARHVSYNVLNNCAVPAGEYAVVLAARRASDPLSISSLQLPDPCRLRTMRSYGADADFLFSAQHGFIDAVRIRNGMRERVLRRLPVWFWRRPLGLVAGPLCALLLTLPALYLHHPRFCLRLGRAGRLHHRDRCIPARLVYVRFTTGYIRLSDAERLAPAAPGRRHLCRDGARRRRFSPLAPGVCSYAAISSISSRWSARRRRRSANARRAIRSSSSPRCRHSSATGIAIESNKSSSTC